MMPIAWILAAFFFFVGAGLAGFLIALILRRYKRAQDRELLVGMTGWDAPDHLLAATLSAYMGLICLALAGGGVYATVRALDTAVVETVQQVLPPAEHP